MRTPAALAAYASLALLLAACGDDGDSGVPGRVTLSDTALTLVAIGQNRLMTATVTDQKGVAIDDPSITWSTTDPQIVVVNGDGLLTAMNVGSVTVTASVDGLVDSATVTVAQAPAKLAKVLGDRQSGPAGAPLPSALTVQVTDALNRPISGVSVDFAVVAGGSIDPANAVTDELGYAGTSFTMTADSGAHEVAATITGTTITTTFTTTIGGPYNIELVFSSPVSPTVAQAFSDAESRWEHIITADVPDDYLIAPQGTCGDNPAYDQPVDDLIIIASVVDIDGPGGILGQAGPCYVRFDSYLPAMGQMIFDSADLAELEAQGLLQAVITHEMGHVLGYGTLWSFKGLLADPSLSGGLDPHFTGAAALSAFNLAGGAAYTGAKVPVENQGGPGTADGHWRETVFNNELMTGYLNLGTNPLSTISIASLGDLGYSVDQALADPYSIILSLRLPTATKTIRLHDDVTTGPIRVIDRKERVIRELQAR